MLAEEDFLANNPSDAYKQWSQQVTHHHSLPLANGSPDLLFLLKKVLAKEKKMAYWPFLHGSFISTMGRLYSDRQCTIAPQMDSHCFAHNRSIYLVLN